MSEHGDERQEPITQAANAVADTMDACVFLYNGRIDRSGLGELVSNMQSPEEEPTRENTLLILTTIGGGADDAYRIARAMQITSDTFFLCIPYLCKSAGTLIALGASRLMMAPMSEIGPLDVQLRQRDEIGEIRSGMVVRTALRGLAEETFSVFEHAMLGIKTKSSHTVSFEVSSRIATNLAARVMAPIYAQIDPDSLGNDLRDLNIATAYGQRLSEFGGNVRPDTIRRLVEEYPSHDFIIDKAETETLFHAVDELRDEVATLVGTLGNDVYRPQATPIIKRLDSPLEEPDEEDQEELDVEHTGLEARREATGNGAPAGQRDAGSPSAEASYQ